MKGVDFAVWGGRKVPAKKILPSGTRFASHNLAVRLTCAPKGVAHVPTADEHDRAHLDFDSAGMLLPAVQGRGSNRRVRGRAREYPESQMTAGGISIDSVFDATHRRQRRLDRELNGDDETR